MSSRSAELTRFLARSEGSRTEACKSFWNAELERLVVLHRTGTGGMALARALAEVVDALVLELHGEAVTAGADVPHALAALGGYGRQEMAPHSDVDLLFLFRRDKDKDPRLITGVLHPLWDLAFDLGHSSRTVSEATRMARQDLASCTAMMDSRYLAGDRGLYDDFRRRLFEHVPRNTAARLQRVRLDRASDGSSVQLLEPNVKESPGGLREIHLLEWGLKAQFRGGELDGAWGSCLEAEELAALQRGRDFLWRVRHDLHFTMRRKHDSLDHELKPSVAHSLGYADRTVSGAIGRGEQVVDFGVDLADQLGPGGRPRAAPTIRSSADRGRELAVEHFMQEYYLHARAVFHFVDLAFGRLATRSRRRGRPLLIEPGVVVRDNEISLPDGRAYFEQDPLRLLGIFLLSQRRRLHLSEQAQRAIRASLDLIDAAYQGSDGARELFLRILGRKQRIAEALRRMHELGVLGAYLPEFAGLNCLVQYDIYHVYTADEHTLVAVENLESLSRAEAPASPLKRVYEEVERRELLYLALLLHDVGKARRQEHVRCGTEMTRELVARLGFSEADGRALVFLVAHHQDMIILSQRRDLDDQRMVADFAGLFPDVELLKALYLMSYADLSAVARDAWTEWQGALLFELYQKTMDQLASGLQTLEDRQDARRLLDGHLQRIQGTWPALRVVAFQEHVQQLPVRYLRAYSLEQVERHLALIGRTSPGGVELDFVTRGDHTEVIICTGDQRQLLSKICGVLAVHDINILRADVQTRDDGVVLDTFYVTDVNGEAALPEHKQERVRERLAEVIRGEVAVEALFARYSAHWSRRNRGLPLRQPEIAFENQVSDRYTVMDVRAQDQVGLLHRITHLLGELDLDIHMAIINTVADRATDAFYVVDAEGRKIVNYEVLETIRERLVQSLQPA
ncbi:MAG: HD domain-containing protein [Gemmatimonadota bacterium]